MTMSRVVVFDEFGGPEVLKVREEPVAAPAAGEVRVRIEAFAVNPLDVMARSGSSPAPVQLPGARLGVEGSGIVDAVGPDVASLRVGDPVIFAAVPDAAERGTYADHVVVPASRVLPRPDGLDAIEAAAVWVGYSTAYGALVETARMRPGDRILITAASGSVGRAAIQLANHLGAEPIAVTRSAGKATLLRDAGAATVIAHDAGDLGEQVLSRTGGEGVDIAFDLVGGPGVESLSRGIRPDGALVLAGFLDPRPAPLPFAPSTIRRYRSFDHTLDPAAVRRMAAFLAAAVRAGALHPAVERVFGFEQVAAAHAHVASGAHQGGKIVVTT
ncbi:zinc-dependent alcohol dehydrogenase family protein [Microbacterium sp. ARD32]|uniref:zinc-dependent alcohol dehydrogenase family protein n=1 Tax=Microbacterium sp. ARD32 TaxID=2962577 RepID=UPI002881AD34|nr:zinc-dependent alcohol dehydrogenase family protein [Microbacterium sp. ARD32]MDT0156199.1 zinc-dependent alcohol dehydrogenase family protein [Microbacterium sp. ARD32]